MSVNNIFKKDVVILGGGLAGLACADELVRKSSKKLKVLVLEKSDHVGGLAATFKYDGFRFDLAPHRWFTKNDELNQWIDELMGEEMIWVDKNTPMFQHGKFFKYPVEFLDVIKKLRPDWTIWMLVTYLWARITHRIFRKKAVTMKDAYINRFGYALYKWFNEEYSNKIWRSCEEMSADWVDQRTKNLSMVTMIKNALGLGGKVISLTLKFRFPKLGIGRIADNLEKRIKKHSGEIQVEVLIKKIIKEKTDYRIFTNKGVFSATHLVSSIPLDELVRLFQPKLLSEVIRAAESLSHVSQKIVVLLANKPRLTPFTWVYIHPPEIKCFRLLETNNWSTAMSPKGKTSLVFEYPYHPGDEIEKMTDEKLVNITIADFISYFSPKTQKSDFIKSFVFTVNKAYPKYVLGYLKPVIKIKNYLQKNLPNLQLIGRNGMFRYNNMDHSVYTGLLAARNILVGRMVYNTQRELEAKLDFSQARNARHEVPLYNIERVNEEAKYLEEKQL